MLSAQLFTSRWRKLRPSFCYCGTKLIKVLPDHLEKDCAAFALHQQGERVPPIPPPCQACGTRIGSFIYKTILVYGTG